MAITVNVVTRDDLLARRLAVYTRRIDKLNIVSSAHPLGEERVDVYVVPVDELSSLLDGGGRPPTWLPVVAYGSKTALGAAFLAGCADYLREPWSPEELSFRVARVARCGDFSTAWGLVRIKANIVATEVGSTEVSVFEYRILRVLLTQLGRTVPRQALYYTIWGRNGGVSRAVDVHVSSLRRKLATIADPAYTGPVIRSSRGLGYFIPEG